MLQVSLPARDRALLATSDANRSPCTEHEARRATGQGPSKSSSGGQNIGIAYAAAE